MREVIAMLEGLGTFEQNVSPSEGGNYSGGGAYPGDQFPTLPSGAYGLAGALAAAGYMVETVEPGDGQNYTGGGAYPGDQFPTSISAQGLASTMLTVEPGNGQNYTGGAAYPGDGFPTLVSGRYGLAAAPGAAMRAAMAGGDRLSRAIAIVRTLLGRYGSICTLAGPRVLEAERSAERYRDWLRNGFGDPNLVRKAKLSILYALATGLQASIVSCSGSTAGGFTKTLENQARAAVAMANALTGNPTNA